MPATLPSSRAVSSALLVIVAAAAVVGASVLRAFHDATPRIDALGAAGSILFPACLLLGGLHLAQRRRGADLLDFPAPARGLVLAQVIPLLVAVLAEKWVTTDLLAGAYDWILPRLGTPLLIDAAYRLWTALGLLAIGLALIPLLRQITPRLRHYTAGHRARRALADMAFAFGMTGLLLAAAAFAAGGIWMWRPTRLLAAAAAAQFVRAVAEEFFYRGLIQTAVVRLLVQAGLPDRRCARILGILLVSAAFALEHAGALVPGTSLVRLLAYVFTMSVMLGTLLEVSRNLYVTMGAHAVHNLVLMGALPFPRGADGFPLLPPAVTSLVLFALLFASVVLTHHRRQRRAAIVP